MALRATADAFRSMATLAVPVFPKEAQGQEPQTPDSIQQAEALIEEYAKLIRNFRNLQESLTNLSRSKEFSVVNSYSNIIISFTPDDEFIYNYCKAKLESDIEDTLLQLKKFDKPLNTL